MSECVLGGAKPLSSSFNSVIHSPLFHSPPASVRTIRQGKAPSRLRVLLMVVKRWWVTGTRGHCVGDANRWIH